MTNISLSTTQYSFTSHNFLPHPSVSAQEIQPSQDNFYSTNIQEQQQNEKYTFNMGVKQNHFQVMWPAGKQVLLKPYWLANKGGPRTAEIPPTLPMQIQ